MKSFRARVLWLLIALVVTIQVATVIVLVVQTNRRAEQQARDDLQTGARVLDALLQSRAEQLRETVNVLVADYSFKQAATLNDAETLVSLLDNSAERVDAQLAVLLDTRGQVLAATIPRLAKHTPVELQQLTLDSTGAPVIRYLTLGDTPYMLVSAPVRAPTPVATAVLGFAVDARLAERLSNLLQYQVSFAVGDLDTAVIVGAAANRTQKALLQKLREIGGTWEEPLIVRADRESYMTWLAPISGAGPTLRLVLQKPLEDALAPYKSLQIIILLVALFALLVALPFALHFAKQISRPLEKLASAARRIETGDYTERIALDAPREFVAVASTLDSMQKNIAERERRIRHQATHDELTGLPNRLLATQTLAQSICDAKGSIALLVIALKDFDQLHASFGFAMGDAVLIEVARRLGSFTGDDDTIACVAKAEFLLIAPGADLDAATMKARQLLQSVRSGFISNGVPISLDAHVGISLHPEHGAHEVELQRRADTALFDAKERGIAIAAYEPARDEQRRRQLALLGDLRRAINADELSLHYQPKVDMRSHLVRSVEALLRWDHPQHGRISPDEFVPLAERTGNVALLTHWVLKKVLWQMREWRSIGFEPDVSMNLSATDLSDADLAAHVIAQLHAFEIPGHRLVLEVTESAVMRDTKNAIATMERLRQHGVRFSVDDFGTGFSSLVQLKQLPVDEIKIDKSFVLGLQPQSDDAVIVRSTIDLGHHLGVKVVAEGVETAVAWRMLLELGCDLAQGYIIARPMNAAELVKRVRDINEQMVSAETATQQLRALRVGIVRGREA